MSPRVGMSWWQAELLARSGVPVRRAAWRGSAATAAASVRYQAGLGSTRAVALYSNGLVQVDEIVEARREQSVTGIAASDVLTIGAHQLTSNEAVRFLSLTGGAGLITGQTYYVVNLTPTTFQLSLTRSGTAVNFTTDITSAVVTYGHIGTADLLADDWETAI